MSNETSVNYYYNNNIQGISTTSISGSGWGGELTYVTPGDYGGLVSVSMQEDKKGKISPQLYFSYIKKKFGILERVKLDGRIKRVEKAFDEAIEAGQNMMAEKILSNLSREIRESVISAKGITRYIERDDLQKFKHNIKEGHISDTMLKYYTRVIPKPILEKVKKLKGVFDDFVIWHYYEEKVEEKRAKKQKMTQEEKAAHRDPVIFGIIKETNRLYFIDDWEDEYCDLSFDEIVDVIGHSAIKKDPKIV